MMALDVYNSLDEWPMPGMSGFITKCNEHGVKEINITGSNTDPALYKHTDTLLSHLRKEIDGVRIGVRTNGVVLGDWLDGYDKGSFSITSMNPRVYKETMGMGNPPNPIKLFESTNGKPWKINIVLTPQGISTLESTIEILYNAGFRKFNIREPYGQEHIGNPFENRTSFKDTLGMPTYDIGGAEVTYWDVHYVHVESVNLYASGNVSLEYPISKGHAEDGVVLDQSNFDGHKRRNNQWVKLTHKGNE